jgi:hypothetical protein
MYESRSNLIIGFHGCEAVTALSLLNDPNAIKVSKEPYDWLGHGMYFWENNLERAMQWAQSKYLRGQIKEPAVIGAVLQLGYCCDLLDTKFTSILKEYATLIESLYHKIGKELPSNRDTKGDAFHDKVIRELDCTLIEFMHTEIYRKFQKNLRLSELANYKLFESTREVFIEGGPILRGAQIYEKSHIQICVRNPNCIFGFFLPRKEIDFYEYLSISDLN